MCTHIQGVQWAFPIKAILTIISVGSSDHIVPNGVLKQAVIFRYLRGGPSENHDLLASIVGIRSEYKSETVMPLPINLGY